MLLYHAKKMIFFFCAWARKIWSRINRKLYVKNSKIIVLSVRCVFCAFRQRPFEYDDTFGWFIDTVRIREQTDDKTRTKQYFLSYHSRLWTRRRPVLFYDNRIDGFAAYLFLSMNDSDYFSSVFTFKHWQRSNVLPEIFLLGCVKPLLNPKWIRLGIT